MQKRTRQGSDFRTGDRVNHYAAPSRPNGIGTVIETGPVLSVVKWDRTGITRSVPNVHLRKA